MDNKYTLEAYDVGGSICTYKHVDITVIAVSEKEAIAKAKEMVKRNVYAVIRVDRV